MHMHAVVMYNTATEIRERDQMINETPLQRQQSDLSVNCQRRQREDLNFISPFVPGVVPTSDNRKYL